MQEKWLDTVDKNLFLGSLRTNVQKTDYVFEYILSHNPDLSIDVVRFTRAYNYLAKYILEKNDIPEDKWDDYIYHWN